MFHRSCQLLIRNAWIGRPQLQLSLVSKGFQQADLRTSAYHNHDRQYDGQEREGEILETPTWALNDLLSRLLNHWGSCNKPRISYLAATKGHDTSSFEKLPARPEVWSATGLTKYVMDLTRLPSKFKETVFKNLLSVLQEDALRSHLTLDAFKEALSYAYKHSDYRAARLLYLRMEDLNMLADPSAIDDEVTEIVLWGNGANNDNLKTYIQILNNHLDNGGSLTPGIWLTLLRIAPSAQYRRETWKIMKDRGMFLDIHVLRKATILTIKDFFEYHLRCQGKFLTFFKNIDKDHGTTDWLSCTAGNIMLRAIGASKWHGPEQSLAMLQYMQTSRGFVPELTTLNAMIYWPVTAKVSNETSSKMSIEILRHFHHLSIEPGVEAFDPLFDRFYRRRYYNSVKVLWRAACLASATTAKMFDAVMNSVLQTELQAPKQPTHAYGHTFRFAVGKIAAGIGREEDDVSCSSSSSNSNPDRVAVQKDTRKFRKYRLKRPLPDLLQSAIEMDERWIGEQTWKSESVSWMRENSIPVDIISAPMMYGYNETDEQYTTADP